MQRTFGVAAHAALEIGYVEWGGTTYGVGTRQLEVGVGQAGVVPAWSEHRTTLLEGTRAGSVWLDPTMVAGVATAMGRRPPRDVRILPRAGRVARLLSLMRLEVGEAGPGRALAVEALAEALLVEVLRQETGEDPTTSGDARVMRAIQRIEAEYASALTIDSLARTAGMSRFHFGRTFRTETGKSPYAYLIAVRIARAAELLTRGHHGVSEAAFAVGFGDLSRFGRTFRAQMGETPSAFAAARLRARST